ncbi:cysteine peptidase family C39 domain-containing protein [Streptococcus uberis]|nr:cysteine peptidase family C39 domain-containing protein [Streptococcus uberis]MCK1203016.1 cysteine peptidase family C39 domain-containing protein [Streptococcus uberis]
MEKNISISQLRNDLEYGSEGATLLGLTSIASKYQLVGETLFGDLEDFILGIERKEILLPVIMHFKLQDGRGHFVIVWKIKNKKNILF